MVSDFVKVFKDLGLKALGGVAKIWDHLLPPDTAQEKGVEIGKAIGQGVGEGLKESFP
jgi:hypothetical protein